MLTWWGRGVLAGSIVLYGLAFVLGRMELVVPASVGVVGLIGALLWTLPEARLAIRREVMPLKVARGEALVAVLDLRNHGRWVLTGLRAHDRVTPAGNGAAAPDHAGGARAEGGRDSRGGRGDRGGPGGRDRRDSHGDRGDPGDPGGRDGELVVGVGWLRRGAGRAVSYEVPTEVRGEARVGPLTVVRRDPLRLTRTLIEHDEDAVFLVRPRTVPLVTAPPGRAAGLDARRGHRAPPRFGGSSRPGAAASFGGTAGFADDATFHGLREYVMGDDLRHVHWRSSARTGSLMVRTLLDPGPPLTTVALDTRAASYEPAGFELAVDAAASVAVAVARAGLPVRLLTGERVLLDVKGGACAAEAVLDRLAVVRACADRAADPVRRLRPGGLLVLVTGDDEAVTRAAAVHRRYDRALCLRIAPGPLPPCAPGVTVIDVPDLPSLATSWTTTLR
ncbi:DUF58 domain-containing protein [Sphaerisporangium corydalis]|uniref:DUF58 domain-containing protein n=1 Tax=Sphaerisporangium corydalis TaxID=1441875 RepID=A0ABV9E972_9ACTN|nr:DUF58 domain-containing protein [Sphaerisporangium corydalis]